MVPASRISDVRTDQTSLCAACRLRFARAAQCPACGRIAIDLRDAGERARAVEALRRSAQRRTWRRWVLPPPGCLLTLVLAVILVSTFAGALMVGQWLGGPAAVFALILLPVSAPVLWVLVFGSAWDRAAAGLAAARANEPPHGAGVDPAYEAGGPPVALRSPEVARSGRARSSVEGRVRLRAPVQAPCSGDACAAYRVVGRHGRSSIDDAGLGAFDVEVDGVVVAHVEAGEGTVDLGAARRATMTMTDRLAKLLRDRTLAPRDASLALGESVLRDGDRVWVEGAERERTSPEGYRGTRAVRVLRDRRGSPLVVRKR